MTIVDWLFDVVKGSQPITEHLIRSLHQMFAQHQDHCEAITADGLKVLVPLIKGQYKMHPNNPRQPDGQIHEYCPPTHVGDEMQRLVAWHQDHTDVAPEVAAAWLHHRFTQIHPFQDGNGRVARALASLVFLRAGTFPLVVRKSDTQYITRLEHADAGELQPLIGFFAQRQKESILTALASEHEVRRTRQISEIISSAVGVLAGTARNHALELKRVFDTADHLIEVASTELKEVSRQIDTQLARIRPTDQNWSSNCRTSVQEPRTSGWYYEQIVAAARDLRYWANFEPYREWIRLGVRTNDTFTFVVAFHGYGRVFRGVLAHARRRVPSYCFGAPRSTGEITEALVRWPLDMHRTLLSLILLAALACGCAKTRSADVHEPTADHDHDHDHGHSHGGGETNLLPADQPCPGPSGPITLRVLDSPELSQDDPIAFMREPEIHWIVSLTVVEVVEGDFSGERLGVLVHSPSMFASEVWGYGASPQQHPAGLELRWTEEYCLFEVIGVETPKPEIDPTQPFEMTAPQVHSAIVE